jgi:hypothetical protein
MPIARIILLCFIFALMLIVPLLLWKDKGNKLKSQEAVERAKNMPPPTTVVEPPALINNLDRFALTFGWVAPPAPERLHASCHGEPRGVANPHRDSCNPYAGDTSCRTELPVLCARPQQGGEPIALATIPGLAGFLLASREDADARCATAHGAGWRMASFHDGGGWEMQGAKLIGVPADQTRRVWVAVNDQHANCWDAAP